VNLNLLQPQVQQYINDNLNTDVLQIVLKKLAFPGCTSQEIAEQIEAKSRIKSKLPTWYATKGIYYANKLNLSQTSSEATANYKATLVAGQTLLDLTAGFGVDSFAFSKKVKKVWHLEKNTFLSKIAQYNLKTLKAKNIEVVAQDGLHFLKNTELHFDYIYIDPSRRSASKEKVFLLADCEPNVITHLALFFSKTNTVLIKTGPLLDIKAGINELSYIKDIHIIALKNEVKEVLWVLEKGYKKTPTLRTINIKADTKHTFNFQLEEESDVAPEFSEPLQYLYEPNAAILKSGAYKLTGHRFGLFKLSQHTHLYTSQSMIDFPGRRFKILKVLPYNKKELKKICLKKANVSIRNFPESVVVIRKKLKLKDGGEDYLFFTKDVNHKLIVIHCASINQGKS